MCRMHAFPGFVHRRGLLEAQLRPAKPPPPQQQVGRPLAVPPPRLVAAKCNSSRHHSPRSLGTFFA